MRDESRFALQFASRMVLSWGNATWWAWSPRGCRRGGTGQAEVGAGAAERRAEEHSSSRAQSGASACLLVSPGPQGARSSTKLTCCNSTAQGSHGSRVCVLLLISSCGNPVPMGGGWLGLGMLLAAPDLQQGIGVAGNIFFPSA